MSEIYSLGRLPLQNREYKEDYYLSPNWYNKNRLRGISALMRSYNDEKWIGPVIQSILPFFDEIVVVFTRGSDRTEKILKNFKSKKIKILDYPFKLKKEKDRCFNSVYDVTYLTNYGLSKTICSHVSPWDSDMVLIPRFSSEAFHDFILSKNVVRASGYNVVTSDFKYASKQEPTQYPSIRFLKVNKYTFYECTPNPYEEWTYKGYHQLLSLSRWKTHSNVQLQKVKNTILHKDIKLKNPIYWHVKPLILSNGIVTKDKWSENINPRYGDFKEKGTIINEIVPDFVHKKPEDYL